MYMKWMLKILLLQILDPRVVRDVLSLMHSCGMYNYSGQFAFKVTNRITILRWGDSRLLKLWEWCSKYIDQKADIRSVCPPRVAFLGRLCLLFQELWGWALPIICKKDLNHLLNNRYVIQAAYESFLFFHSQDFDHLSLNLVFGNPKGYNISFPIFHPSNSWYISFV